jgi:tetratricopeptide (TPR) repeat protein
VLRAHAEASSEEDLRADLAGFESRITTILPELAPRLAESANRATESEQAPFELFEAIASWIRRSARRTPLVLLVDDLHWADEASVRLLQHVVEALRNEPVLIIGTYRDAEVPAGHPFATLLAEVPRLGKTEHVQLSRLSEDAVAKYIEAATGRGVGPRLAQTVYRQTDGNALFVTEVVRLLTTSGSIDQADVSWTAEIPAGVRGVIGRRLSSLSATCSEVLTAAAAIGREFELRVLLRASDAGLDPVMNALDEAMAAKLVVLAPDSSRRQGHYVFSHALVRDTLYDDLASGRRLGLHARIAAVLEELYGANPGLRIGALAHHFREAAAMGDTSKAVEYTIRAGDAARQVFAYEECVRQWDMAIELLGDEGKLEEQADILQRAADVMFVSGVGFERGVGYLERALRVWERVGNKSQQARAHSRLGRTFTTYPRLTDLHRAERHLSRAIELLPPEEISVAKGYTWVGLASAQDRMLQTQAGLTSARAARQIGEQLKRENLAALGQQLEGGFLAKLGRNREGAALMDEAWEIADRIGDPVVSFYCSWTRGAREMNYRGNPRGATQFYLRELQRPNMSEAVIPREQLSVELAYAYFRCGDLAGLQSCEVKPDERWYNEYEFEGRWQEALPGLMRDLETNERAGNKLVEGMRATAVGLDFFQLGRVEEAAEVFERGVEVVKVNEIGAELRLRALAATAVAELGRQEIAAGHLSRCDEIISWGDEWLGQIGCTEIARATVQACLGQTAAAEGSFKRAIEIIQRYELVWDEAEAFRLWGRVIAGNGERSQALEKFQRAIDVYRRIGAGAPWISRILHEYARVPSDDADQTWDA